MGCCREGADIWLNLLKKYPNGDWMGWRLFKRRFWRNRYLLHDSFGQYWSRWVGCPILGHRNVQNVSDPGEPKKMHCFNCGKCL